MLGRLLILAVACVALTMSAQVRAHEESARGVLLLKTGGALPGEITVVGNRYVVQGEKSRIDVGANQVAFVCRSLEDAYERQREQLARPTAESHLALADWCMRYGLAEQAAAEIAESRRLDPRHPRIALLERRLAVMQTPRGVTAAAGTAEAAGEKQVAELRSLEAMASKLPAGTVERFARKVQPLLVNGCTTSGCHQPNGKQEFQLDRAVLHGLSNRRTTLRNLSATLALVDQESPHESSLLTVPATAHGGKKAPLLGSRQDDHLKVLAEWIALATGTTVAPPEIAATPKPRSASRDGERRAPVSDPLVMPTAAAKMLAAKEEASLFEGLPPVRVGVEITPSRPRDEFDPEVFNRQYRSSTDTGRLLR